jgi:hypothetical protein
MTQTDAEVDEFLRAVCTFDPTQYVSSKSLWVRYSLWCKLRGGDPAHDRTFRAAARRLGVDFNGRFAVGVAFL